MSCIPAPYARRLLLATFLGAAIAPASRAGDVVIYRCTDASGALTLQNAPCPKGMKQEQRTLQGVNTVPMAPANSASPPTTAQTRPAAPTRPATQEPAPAAPATDASRLPPPVLFQCTTYDKDTYVTEDSEPASVRRAAHDRTGRQPAGRRRPGLRSGARHLRPRARRRAVRCMEEAPRRNRSGLAFRAPRECRQEPRRVRARGAHPVRKRLRRVVPRQPSASAWRCHASPARPCMAATRACISNRRLSASGNAALASRAVAMPWR